MKVLFAGGTGFVGRHLAAALLGEGHEVTVLSRSPGKVRALPGLGEAGAVRGDVTDPASLRGALEGHEAVATAVQFPNYPMEQPRRGLTFDRFDRGGTENLLAAAKATAVRRFFYVSGVGADPGSDKPWYRAKGLAEEAIRASGLRYAILRPSWAYGPGDQALNRIATVARRSPVAPRLGAGVQRIQPVYVGDLALAAGRIFARDEAWDRIFELGGPEVMTMTEVIRTMLEVMGLRRAVVPVPAWLAKAATAPLDLLPRPPMNPAGVDFAVQDGLADNRAAESLLGLRPVPLREGLARYLA